MKHISSICADAGTINCPCPLAETGDCLICSRLAGNDKCDCSWAGLCIYNEFMQNDGTARNRRSDRRTKIVRKSHYGKDLVVIELDVGKNLALNGAVPGSFVFLKCSEDDPFFDVPISVMRADVQNGTLTLAVKIMSAKTKALAAAKDHLILRGIYRNGLLGKGMDDLEKKGKWLIITRGAGFAPAVNLLDWSEGKTDVHLHIDTNNITEELVSDMIKRSGKADCPLKITLGPLEDGCKYDPEDYDKIFILASDYYIRTVAADLQVPSKKLIYANNFHMCCGEGICGACTYVDEKGVTRKMCKCRRSG